MSALSVVVKKQLEKGIVQSVQIVIVVFGWVKMNRFLVLEVGGDELKDVKVVGSYSKPKQAFEVRDQFSKENPYTSYVVSAILDQFGYLKYYLKYCIVICMKYCYQGLVTKKLGIFVQSIGK